MKIQLGIYNFTPLCTNWNGQACQISVIGFPFYCKLGIFEASPIILHTCRPAVYSIKPSVIEAYESTNESCIDSYV